MSRKPIGGFLIGLFLVGVFASSFALHLPGFNPLPCQDSAYNRIKVFAAYNDAADPAGAFTIGGCTIPNGQSLQLWFEVIICHSSYAINCLASEVPTLPTSATPDTLTSRSTDGHWHKSYIIDKNLVLFIALAKAKLTNTGEEASAFLSVYIFRNYVSPDTPLFTLAPEERNPQVNHYWTFSNAGPGGFIIFTGSPFMNASRVFNVQIWFKDHNQGDCIPTLPCDEVTAWTGHSHCITDGHCTHLPTQPQDSALDITVKFVMPADHGLDETRPNVDVFIRFMETEKTYSVTLWWHQFITIGGGGGGGCHPCVLL